MTGHEAAPPGAASYVYAAGARSRAGVAKGIADMQNKVDEVFVGKVRLLSIDGERSGKSARIKEKLPSRVKVAAPVAA